MQPRSGNVMKRNKKMNGERIFQIFLSQNIINIIEYYLPQKK